MTDHINPTHAILDAATEAMCIEQIASKIHGPKITKTQTKAVERDLRELHKASLLEFTPGRGGVSYYRLTTPTAPAALQPKPSAAAVAVLAAIDGGPTLAPDLAQQLREDHAERLAMSQTFIAICCAIGRDPGQTTTAELAQQVKDAITEARNSNAHQLAVVIGKIRQAIGDNTNRIALDDLAEHIEDERNNLLSDRAYFVGHFDAIRPITEALLAGYIKATSPGEAVQIMAQLIEAQHEHIQDQAQDIEAAVTDLTAAYRVLNDQEQQIANLRAQLEAQAAQHQAETGLLAEKNANLHAELEHLRSQPAPVACGKADPAPDAFFVLRHDWKHRVTRHKSRETAERTVTSALRAGAGQADIYAAKRIAIGKRHPVIKPV